MQMTKRLIEIDDDLLERARNASRASTIKETVEIALQKLVDDNPAKRHLETLLSLQPFDLELLEEARRPRFPPND